MLLGTHLPLPRVLWVGIWPWCVDAVQFFPEEAKAIGILKRVAYVQKERPRPRGQWIWFYVSSQAPQGETSAAGQRDRSAEEVDFSKVWPTLEGSS